MRTVCTVTIALLALAPMGSRAATPIDPYAAIEDMRAAFSHVHSVQAIERFPDGNVATVQLTPPARSAAAVASTSKRQLLLEYVAQPAGDVMQDVHEVFSSVTPVGHKKLYDVPVDGYRMVDQSGAIETVWVNSLHLPVAMHIEGYGTSMDVLYGNYDNPTFFATKPK